MTEETESGARRVRPGLMGEMVNRARQADRDRAEHQARAAVPAHPGLTVPMVWTDEMARWGRTGHLDPLDPPASRGPLARVVRRANGARRVTRALRAILARLVKRANL